MTHALPLPVFEGTPFDVGHGLGRHFAAAAGSLTASAAWRELQAGTDLAQLRAWRACVRDLFPHCWEELQGMAAGMGIDPEALLLWNCRDGVRAEHGGSCTIAVNRLGSRFLIHAHPRGIATHEQAAPVEVRPHGKPVFACMATPGALPGIGAAASSAGLVQLATRVSGRVPSAVPAGFVARSVLDADSLAAALDIVMRCGSGCGARHLLASSAEFIMAAVDGGPGEPRLMPISNKLLLRQDVGAVHEPACDALQELYMKLPGHPGEDDILGLWHTYRHARASAHGQAVFLSIGRDGIDLHPHGGPTMSPVPPVRLTRGTAVRPGAR